jgi:DNA-binding FadR family transcriptional regulator
MAKAKPAAATSDRVAEITAHLEKLILSGKLRTDDRLPPERELAEQWDVSRSVVREAIGRLAALGLVRSRQGSGTRIAVPDGSHQLLNYEWLLKHGVVRLEHLCAVRLPLETTIAAMAAEHRTDAHLRELRAAQKTFGNQKLTLKAHVEADVRFHAVLCEASGNPLFQIILAPVQELMIESRRRAIGRYGNHDAHRQHETILDAVVRRDVDAAREAMREHILFNSQNISALAAEGDES